LSRAVRAPTRRLLLGLALLLGISCRDAATTATTATPAGSGPPPEPAAVVERVRVFLIAPQDGGRAGRKVACGDSAVPVEVTLPRPAPALEGALRALLAMSDHYDRGSGLLNPLYASRLGLAGLELQGAQVRVRLTGYVELGDACDNSRMLAELSETALQFRGISDAQFELDGQPLRELLLGRAAPARFSRVDRWDRQDSVYGASELPERDAPVEARAPAAASGAAAARNQAAVRARPAASESGGARPSSRQIRRPSMTERCCSPGFAGPCTGARELPAARASAR
jgi:hypothetical protein